MSDIHPAPGAADIMPDAEGAPGPMSEVDCAGAVSAADAAPGMPSKGWNN